MCTLTIGSKCSAMLHTDYVANKRSSKDLNERFIISIILSNDAVHTSDVVFWRKKKAISKRKQKKRKKEKSELASL